MSNRLAKETSPYLKQHAENPVDWYPWGAEAVERARREDKPILLSVGYSACHWCHVMEKESFEDPETAAEMNEKFVNIKVDREERPDLDQIYQNAVQLFIRRGGGWPLTMFLSPDGVPFYGGTYFPPEDRHGIPAFRQVLAAVEQVWREKRQEVVATGADVVSILQRTGTPTAAAQEIDPALIEKGAEGLASIFEPRHGGFGGAPKFPATMSLEILLRHGEATGDRSYIDRVAFTLMKMGQGGIYDQLGGGFHRYSVDDRWLVPHFEKMLYDNVLLPPLYFALWRLLGDEFYRRIGAETLDWILREMTAPEGAFYSTLDADSEGVEGKFYVWSRREVQDLLGEDAELFGHYYDVTDGGNWEEKNILHVDRPVETLAKEFSLDRDAIFERLSRARQKLLAKREERVRPARDEKVLTSWNGLALSAFAAGYEATGDPRYLAAAERAAEFLLATLRKEGRLLRTAKDGVAKLNAYLDDYAFLANGLADLFEAGGDSRYLAAAEELAVVMVDQFADREGGFYFTSRDHETLIARLKTAIDQSIPSGNAIAARLLLRLYWLTERQEWHDLAEKTLKLFLATAQENPFGMGAMLVTADFYLRKPKEIVIVGKKGDPMRTELVRKVHSLFLPNRVLLAVEPGTEEPKLAHGKMPVDSRATVYVCRNFTCSPPLTDWESVRLLLTG